MDAEGIIKLCDKLKAEHAKWTGVWADCARYCLPNASPFANYSARTRGSKKRQPIDITGVIANSRLASYLYSNTVYSDTQWFSIVPDYEGSIQEDLKDEILERELQRASKKVLKVIASSNFDSIYLRMLRNYCGFGTGVFYSEFNDEGELVCRQWQISDVYVAENSKGSIDTVLRTFGYTARQAVQEFGLENVSEEIRKAFVDKDSQNKRFDFIHAVFPRTKRDKRKKIPSEMPIASVYVETESKKIVYEGGYRKMPYQTPRFFDTGEIYGRSSAMEAIPALRSLNACIWAYLKNIEGQSKPIVFAPSDVYDRISTEFGSVNPWDSQQGDIKIWTSTGDTRSPLEFAEQKREEVSKIFYNDVFQYLEDRKNMTATEAQLRYDEMIQAVSPVLSNLQSEFFSPFIERVVLELFERGEIEFSKRYLSKDGKMPKFKIVYITRLDTKLKSVLSANIINFIRTVSEICIALANAPQVSAYVDFDKIIHTIASNNNVSDEILADEKAVKEALEQMNQQAQMQQLSGLLDKINVQKTPEKNSIAEAMLNGNIPQ